MKAHHFIAPALAIVAGGFWISQQEDTLTELEEKTRIVKERLQQFDSAVSAATSEATAKGEDKEKDEFTLPDGTLDWKLIAELIAESQNGNGMPANIKTYMKLQARFMELDENELEVGLAKIATLDLNKEVADQLKQALIHMMSEKNPGKALQFMGDIITSREDPLHWPQQNAFRKFAAKDPASALAWLDQQVKNGKFVSKALDPGENPRFRFESALLGSLLESDLATVQARLKTFNEEERKQLFSDTELWRQNGKMSVEFLELARQNLSEEQATASIANAWAARHNVELKDVTVSINDVPFSDEERGAIVKTSLQNFLQNTGRDENSHKTAYEWAREQSPENAGPLLAQSLAKHGLWQNRLEGSFQKALDLTDTFQDPSVAQEFVNLWAQKSNDNWQRPLDNFKDPALAEKMRAIYETLPKDSE